MPLTPQSSQPPPPPPKRNRPSLAIVAFVIFGVYRVFGPQIQVWLRNNGVGIPLPSLPLLVVGFAVLVIGGSLVIGVLRRFNAPSPKLPTSYTPTPAETRASWTPAAPRPATAPAATKPAPSGGGIWDTLPENSFGTSFASNKTNDPAASQFGQNKYGAGFASDKNAGAGQNQYGQNKYGGGFDSDKGAKGQYGTGFTSGNIPQNAIADYGMPPPRAPRFEPALRGGVVLGGLLAGMFIFGGLILLRALNVL